MGNTVIQSRNDTATNWTTANPTLALGEMGLETDTNRIKFGDGTTAWNSLPYVGAGASFKYGMYTLSTDQTSNLALGNHIEFNTTQGSLGGLATGSGQANGIITLTGGKTYKITCDLLANFSTGSTGYVNIQIYDRTNSVNLGKSVKKVAATYTSASYSANSPCLAIVTASTDINIDVRFDGASNFAVIYNGYTWLLIEEYGGY